MASNLQYCTFSQYIAMRNCQMVVDLREQRAIGHVRQIWDVLLMEEILHHLKSLKS